MMPLAMAKSGETVVIRKITGKDSIRQHLAELGLVVDESVTVVSELGGNIILQVKDSRIALDRSMATRIMVRIMDMGITKGVQIKVRKVAPLGDPIELNVRGYELSVRKADAEMIEVE